LKLKADSFSLAKPANQSICLSFRCQLPNNQIVNDHRPAVLYA
jgi:hypothetical protein